MNDVAREYGEALFDLCYDEGIDGEVLSQIRAVKPFFETGSDYVRFLSSPNIPSAERSDAVGEAFSGRVNSYVVNFLKIMTERSHARQIAACFDRYETLYNEKHNISEARAISAVELSEDQKKTLTETLSKKTGKTVVISFEVDPALIGGISVFIDGELYDGSVSSHLDAVRRRLEDITIN